MAQARRSPWAFFAALALFIVAVLSLTAYTLWLLRSDAIKSGLAISAIFTRSFEDHLTQSLRVSELAGVNAASSEKGQLNLRQMETNFVFILRNSPFLRSVSLLDESNLIIASSNSANLGITVSTKDFFPVAAGTQSFLRLGTPWAGRDFADGHAIGNQMPEDTSGRFLPATHGVDIGPRNLSLLVALNPDYFLNFMSRQFDTRSGSVEVLRLDGIQLMSTDYEQRFGAPKNEFTNNGLLYEVEFGEFEQSLHGERPVLTTFRVSPLYPLAVVTHIQRDYALSQWETETKTILGIVVPTLLIVSLMSISRYRRQQLLEAKTNESNRLQQINAARVFTNSHEGIMMCAADGNILDVNDAFTRITGYGRDEILGQNPRILTSGRQTKEFYADLWRDLSEHGFWSGELWNRHKNGEVYAEMLTISAVSDSQGVVQQFVGQFADVTKRKMLDDQVRLMAFFDPLRECPDFCVRGAG